MSTRREFLQASGALAFCFALPACSGDEESAKSGHTLLGNRLQINADGSVDLMLGKVEFGQGIGTTLAQLAAEELDLDFSRVRLSYVDTDSSPNEFYTFSSISVQQAGPPTRKAAAQARAHLLQLAADRLGVAAESLTVADGQVLANGAQTAIDYWSLIGDEHATLELVEDVTLKPVDDYSVIGKSVLRIDIPGKVFGEPSFLQDLRLPDMVHARVVRPSAERAVLEGFNATVAEAMPGVLKVVRDGSFVAVIAEREEQARNAAKALGEKLEWRVPGDLPDSEALYDWLRNVDSRTEPVAEKTGNVDRGAVKTVSATYQRPYQAHASISPSAAVARFADGQLTVWSHAQGMYPLRAGIAKVLGLDIADVRCVHREASGCYGHNGADDAACDAAALAVKFPGRHVRVQWERADEMTWEPYGSAMHIEVSAGIDDAGQIRSWDYDLWSCPHTSRPRDEVQAENMIYARQREGALPLPPIQSIPQPNGGADRNGVPLYTFDRVNVRKHLATDVPMRVSALRGLGAYANVFAIESFMDELADIANEDPFSFRLRHLQDERAIALLEELERVSDWKNRPAPGTGGGWGLGFARFKNRSAWVGVVMRVTVKDGDIQLRWAKAVCDAGLIINPDGVRAQIEGGIVQSSSWTLKEQVRFSNEQKQSVDWNSYPILRFDEIPDIDVTLMDRNDQASMGVGEAAQGPTAAAIANAVFHATGKRLRRLPLVGNERS